MNKTPFNGSVYRCSDCGSIFNTVDYTCPVCALKELMHESVELGVATATMSEDDGETESEKIND